MGATITTSAGTTKPWQELRKFGQAAWLDYIRRSLITGGRCSALSDFRMLLAAVMGMDALRFLDRAEVTAITCSSCLLVTCDDKADLPVPGQRFTFGVVKAAQARGDLQVLAGSKQRVLRVHLHDVESGLAALQTAIAKALS